MAVKYDRIGDGYDLTRRADPRIFGDSPLSAATTTPATHREIC